MAYYILLLLAFWLNRKDDRTLFLILIVAASVLFPYKQITDYDAWHAAVCVAECLIIFSAYKIQSDSSGSIIVISIIMICAHLTNYYEYSPKTYKSVILFLEHLHLLTFIITSNLVMTIIKRKLQWIVQL